MEKGGGGGAVSGERRGAERRGLARSVLILQTGKQAKPAPAGGCLVPREGSRQPPTPDAEARSGPAGQSAPGGRRSPQKTPGVHANHEKLARADLMKPSNQPREHVGELFLCETAAETGAESRRLKLRNSISVCYFVRKNFHIGCINLHSHQQSMRVPCSSHPHQQLLLSF
ncbi:unnamed protein product [Rangifer tarandus platyrhynchus]|uniref:Uncharacterized protein n=1 Tax=Rangifer tarandus platyrhynchus TaxID=3082113 RepID=A0AC59Z2I7_RANTA